MALLYMRRRSALSLLLLMLLALASAALTPSAQAQQCIGDMGPGSYVVFRAGSEGEKLFTNLTLSQVTAKNGEMEGQGWYLYTVDGYALGCELEVLRYTAVYKQGVVEQAWALHWKRADFEAENTRLRGLGWRLTTVDTQTYKFGLTYNGIWRKSSAEQTEKFAMTTDAFIAENDRLRGLGWRLTVMDTFEVDALITVRYYNGIWRKSTREQIDYYGWSKSDFVNEYNNLAGQGWRMHIIEGGGAVGSVNASLVKGTVAERLWLGSSSSDLSAKVSSMHSSGWRIYRLSHTR